MAENKDKVISAKDAKRKPKVEVTPIDTSKPGNPTLPPEK